MRSDRARPSRNVARPGGIQSIMNKTPHDRLTLLSWLCRIIAALILLQTLFFKFSGSEESVYIFSRLGVEPWGRWAAGIAELITSILLVIPRTGGLGAMIGIGVMLGAILSHLVRIGVVVKNDGGLLFALAIVVTLCCGVVAFVNRRDLPIVGARL